MGRVPWVIRVALSVTAVSLKQECRRGQRSEEEVL